MRFSIGQRVYYRGEEWEIFLYMGGKYSKAALYCWYRDQEYEKLGKVNPYVISFYEHRP